MEYKDYYRTLGVPKGASQAEIKKAFRALARKHHPDVTKGDKASEQRFKDVNEAYEVLGDPEKRTRYDQLGANWAQYARAGNGASGGDPFAGFAGSGPFGAPGGIRYEFRTAGGDAGGFSDFFRMFFGGDAGAGAGMGGFGGFGDPADLGRAQGHAQGRASGGRSGGRAAGGPAPLEVRTDVSLEEAFHGTSRLVEVEGRRFEVAIPRGIDTGGRVRLSGTGPGGRDVVVGVTVLPHHAFTRRGADLETELPITLREALLGGQVPVTTLKGRVLLTIPAGTQAGRTFRLSGQGMPRLKAEGAGDLRVRVKVVLPSALDVEATAAAERFLDLVAQPDPRSA